MKTFSNIGIHVGDGADDVVKITQSGGYSLIRFSPDVVVWFRTESRVALLRDLRDAITAHLAEISPDAPNFADKVFAEGTVFNPEPKS